MVKKKVSKPTGRPKQFDQRTKWTTWLDADLAARADEHRKADQRSQSWLVSQALTEYLARHSE